MVLIERSVLLVEEAIYAWLLPSRRAARLGASLVANTQSLGAGPLWWCQAALVVAAGS